MSPSKTKTKNNKQTTKQKPQPTKQNSLEGTLTNLSSSAPPTGAGRPHSPQVFPSWSCESQHQAYSHHFRSLPPSCPRAQLDLTGNTLLIDKSYLPSDKAAGSLNDTAHGAQSQVRKAGLSEPTCKDIFGSGWVTHPFRGDSGTAQAWRTRVSGRYGHNLKHAPGSTWALTSGDSPACHRP